MFFLVCIKRSSYFKNQKIIKTDPAIVYANQFSNGDVFYNIPCPHCHKVFYPIKYDLKIKRSKNDDDFGYFICPECGEMVIINSFSLGYFNYTIDFLGNIIRGNDLILSNIIYVVQCPCGTNQIEFKFEDTHVNYVSHSKKHIICPNCHNCITLSKKNVKILIIYE